MGRGEEEGWETFAGCRNLVEGQGQGGECGDMKGGLAAAPRARILGNGVCHGSQTGWGLPVGTQPSSIPQDLSLLFLEVSCLPQAAVCPSLERPQPCGAQCTHPGPHLYHHLYRLLEGRGQIISVTPLSGRSWDNASWFEGQTDG